MCIVISVGEYFWGGVIVGEDGDCIVVFGKGVQVYLLIVCCGVLILKVVCVGWGIGIGFGVDVVLIVVGCVGGVQF